MKSLRNQKGQSLIEFAIILPLLLLILMSIAEFGMMLNSYLTIRNACREGARSGIVGSFDADIKSTIVGTSPSLEEADLTINITPSYGNRKSGDPLTVSLSYKYHLTVPIISGLLNNTVILNSQTTMRIE